MTKYTKDNINGLLFRVKMDNMADVGYEDYINQIHYHEQKDEITVYFVCSNQLSDTGKATLYTRAEVLNYLNSGTWIPVQVVLKDI